MTWGRIVHPSEMFSIGDEVEVLVLKYNPDEQKVSLGLKQKTQNPWESVSENYSAGTKITGRIVSLTDYGAFIELEPGVEGLIHVSEMSWTKKIRHPSKVVQLGQEVDAVVKEIDVERKRISLSMKEAEPNPWRLALERYPIGSVVISNPSIMMNLPGSSRSSRASPNSVSRTCFFPSNNRVITCRFPQSFSTFASAGRAWFALNVFHFSPLERIL